MAGGKSFEDPEPTNLQSLRFEYAPAILEAFPGVYVIDGIQMKKRPR